jgi:peptide/nickel transport system substrate-binding protein
MDLTQRPLTRRSLFALAGRGALALSAGAILAGCGGANTPTASGNATGGAAGPATSAVRQTTATVGVVGDLNNLDPFVLSAVNFPMEENLYDQLLRLNNQVKSSPDLALAATPSSDGKAVTLKLRPGVRFDSGATMTADDVVKNFQRAQVKATGGNLYGWLQGLSGVEATAPDEVTLHFPAPAPQIFDVLGMMSIVDPSDFAQLKSTAGGTGPFRLKEWVPGDHFTLVKNPAYWQSGVPLLEQVTFRVFDQPDSMVSSLQGGALDIAMAVPPNSYAELQASGFQMITGQDGAEFYYLGMSPKQPPFDNQLVRQAMAHAVDKATMCKQVLYGLVKPIGTPFPKYSPAYFSEFDDPYPFDLQKAKALLAQAGYPDGISFSIPTANNFPELAQLAQILQADLAKIGCRLQINPMDPAQWYPILTGGTYQAIFSFAGGTQMYPTLIAGSGNFAPAHNTVWPGGNPPAAYAEGLRAANSTLDPAAQKKALHQMVASLVDQSWVVPVAQRQTFFALKKQVQGFTYGIFNQPRMSGVSIA